MAEGSLPWLLVAGNRRATDAWDSVWFPVARYRRSTDGWVGMTSGILHLFSFELMKSGASGQVVEKGAAGALKPFVQIFFFFFCSLAWPLRAAAMGRVVYISGIMAEMVFVMVPEMGLMVVMVIEIGGC